MSGFSAPADCSTFNSSSGLMSCALPGASVSDCANAIPATITQSVTISANLVGIFMGGLWRSASRHLFAWRPAGPRWTASGGDTKLRQNPLRQEEIRSNDYNQYEPGRHDLPP